MIPLQDLVKQAAAFKPRPELIIDLATHLAVTDVAFKPLPRDKEKEKQAAAAASQATQQQPAMPAPAAGVKGTGAAAAPSAAVALSAGAAAAVRAAAAAAPDVDSRQDTSAMQDARKSLGTASSPSSERVDGCAAFP